MKFISWNVNGIRACVQKGFLDFFNQINADFFCLQETKMQEGQLTLDLPSYHQFYNYAQKKGYSGTAIFAKHPPLSVSYGLGVDALDTEGRLITLEYADFYLITCYTPNAQRGLARIEHRMAWEEAFLAYIQALDKKRPVILCGDLNVAHQEIDLKNPKTNRRNAGFTDEERANYAFGLTGIHWRHLDEDVSFESFFYEDAEPTPLQHFFLTHKEINVAEFAKKVGINASLLRNYINGFKKPSKEREEQILNEIHKIGEKYLAVAF